MTLFLCRGDRVRSASARLSPFVGTVLHVTRNLQIIAVQIDGYDQVTCFDIDDLEVDI